MSRKIGGQPRRIAQEAIAKYRTILEDIHPPAKGRTRVVVRDDDQVVVCVPLPTRARERMRLFDRMAEVATRLLLETDQYIVLSGR